MHHNLSLTHGQKLLRLPPHPAVEEIALIAGYKVTCSADYSMLQLVDCYEGLANLNTEYILLDLPDITQFYYAALQLVRNFNGVELPEGNISVSSAFCTGVYSDQHIGVMHFFLYVLYVLTTFLHVKNKNKTTLRLTENFFQHHPEKYFF